MKRIKISRMGFFFLLFLLSMSGCSSYFYYPDHVQYVNSSRLPVVPEEVFFEAEDQQKLHGWYFSAKSTPQALVILFHGNAQNLSSHFFQLYFLLEDNFDLFVFDYRGYGKSQGKPTPNGTVMDGLAALTWAKARSPKLPMIIYGSSLGGAVGMKTYIESKKKNMDLPIKLFVAEASFSSYPHVAMSVVKQSWLTWWLQPIAWLITDGQYSPEKELEWISPTPLLIVHGDQDPVVPSENSKRLYEKSSQPKFIKIISSSYHTQFLMKNQGVNRRPFVALLKRALACGPCFEDLLAQFQ